MNGWTERRCRESTRQRNVHAGSRACRELSSRFREIETASTPLVDLTTSDYADAGQQESAHAREGDSGIMACRELSFRFSEWPRTSGSTANPRWFGLERLRQTHTRGARAASRLVANCLFDRTRRVTPSRAPHTVGGTGPPALRSSPTPRRPPRGTHRRGSRWTVRWRAIPARADVARVR